MKRINHRIKILLIFCAILTVFAVHAEGGVTFTSATCNVGDEVTIEMTISEPFNAGSIQLSHGKQLEFVSCEADNTFAYSGWQEVYIATQDMSTEARQMSYRLKFKALESGTATIGIMEIKLSLADGSSVEIPDSSWGTGTVTINPSESQAPTDPPTEPPTQPPTEPTTEEPTTEETDPPTEPTTIPPREPSHDAALSWMELQGGGSLSPAFSPDVFYYRQEIPTDVSSLEVRYALRDGGANAWYNSYLREIEYGETDFLVHVTAEDGYTTNEYHVTIYRPWPQSQPATEPVESSEEATTEEPTTEENTMEPTTEEATTEPMVILEGMPLLFKVLPLPTEDEIPAGYVKKEIRGSDGLKYEALVPEGVKKPDHYILYGIRLKEVEPETTQLNPEETLEAPEETQEAQESTAAPRNLVEEGEAGYYIYDLQQGTLQRMGLLIAPTTEESTTEATTEAATTEAPTTAPATTPAATTPGEAETEAAKQGSILGGVPWWMWVPVAGILCTAAYSIFKLVTDKKQLEEELQASNHLSEEEEDAFLSMDKGALYTMAATSNPPWELEDLDAVLDAREEAVAETPEMPETETPDHMSEPEA